MSNASYGINDEDGNELTRGVPEHIARKTAQSMANRRGEPVVLFLDSRRREDETAEEHEARTACETFEPEPALYAVWGEGAVRHHALANADGSEHIATRIAATHDFDSTVGERWAVIVSGIDENDLDADPAVHGYRELTESEISEFRS